PSILETSSWLSGFIAASFCMGAVVAPGAGLAGLLGEVDIWAEAAPVMSASAATVAIGSLRMERLQCSYQLSCERAAFAPGSAAPRARGDSPATPLYILLRHIYELLHSSMIAQYSFFQIP